jgi:elongation factor Ts
MNISATDVKNLREQTGAGMMDCKKALAEANGDFNLAVEILRKKGQKVSEKRADRDANQGTVIVKISADGTHAAALSLNCETDFVARNEEFLQTANDFATMVFENKLSSFDQLKDMAYKGITVGKFLDDMIGKIGEKIAVNALHSLNTTGQIVAYEHPGNQLAVLVEFDGRLKSAENGRDVAMQIAAMRPIAVSSDQVDSSVLEKELEIAKEQLINEGKPADIAEKAAQGKLRRFFEESVLLDQKFVKDNSVTIAQFLKNSGEPTVKAFWRLQLGETA